MTQVYLNELTHGDTSACVALNNKWALDIHYALDRYMDCSSEHLVGIPPQMDTGGFGYLTAGGEPHNAVWHHTSQGDQVIAITNCLCDAQRVAAVMNLYYGFKDQGAQWLQDNPKPQLDLLVGSQCPLNNT